MEGNKIPSFISRQKVYKMYLRFVSNFNTLNLYNGKFLLISKTLPPLEQKPFFAFEPTDSKNAFICFMNGNQIYQTPFKMGCSPSVIAKLSTLLLILDRELVEIDVPLYLVRHGIPLNEIDFKGKEVILKPIDAWKALDYHRLTKAATQSILKDLRDTLYI